jgi:polyphosphate kinase
VEPQMIRALYEASCAGVRIDLIVRGICCLRPGIPGVSENIHVRSIIGRFLEHTRVYWFLNAAEAAPPRKERNDEIPVASGEVFCASADWMERNFFRRVEVCFPVLDPQLKKRVINEGLKPYLEDNGQAWKMSQDGEYHLEAPQQGGQMVAQETLLKLLAQRSSA